MNDPALTYLQGDSSGPKRDLIARCYYQVAQGDPDSGPVAFAILMRASAEQLAKTPKELAEIVTSFQKVLANAAEMERRTIEKVEQNNASVVAEFKKETRRSNDILQDTMVLSNVSLNRAKAIEEMLKLLHFKLEHMLRQLHLLDDHLKAGQELAKIMAEAAAKIQKATETSFEPVKRLTQDMQFYLVTSGFLGGMLFEQLNNQSQAFPWTGLIALLLVIGWVRRLLYQCWKLMPWLMEKWRFSAKSKI